MINAELSLLSKKSSLVMLLIFLFGNLSAQTDGVSIDYSGSPTREPKAIFQANSTEQGVILPRMTGAQRVAIAPPTTAKGMTVYQTDGTAGYFYWDGTQWLRLLSTVGSGSITVTPSGVGLSVTGSPVSLGGTVTISSNATSSSTPNTIVSRNAAGDFSAGLITANFNGEWRAKDDRIIEPNSITSRSAQFGFTSYNNNNTSPYADYLHLRSYGDATGGKDNLVMFAKDQIAMRVYQHTFNSSTPYTTYKTVAFVEDLSNFSGLANPSATIGLTAINGSATTALRSDAAPALSQSIIPTWTGTHTFSNATYSALFTGGNVGIGTTTPTQKLDVDGDLRVGVSSAAGLTIKRFSPALTDVPGSTSGIQLIGPVNAHVVLDIQGNDANDGFYVRVPTSVVTNPTVDRTAFVVKASGNVGVGTSSPTQTLDIDGKIRIRGGLPGADKVLQSDANGVATWVDATTLSVTGDNLGDHIATQNIELNNKWLSNDGGNEGIRVDDSGNVGIGMASPQATLHVPGNLSLSNSNGVVRKYSSNISSTQSGLIKMGQMTFTGSSQNLIISGKVYIQSGNSAGETDFSIMIRTNTFPSKGIKFWQTQTIAGYTVNIKVYEDPSSGLVVVGFDPGTTIQSFGWDITVFERANWNIWENEDGYTALNTSGLTEATGGSNHYNLNPGGNVGIGTSSPTYKLHVMGRLKTTGINETSDIRLKTNIQPISNALEAVLKMKGVTYNWRNKEFPEMGLSDDVQHGLIAQELEKIIPELVLTDKEGWKSIEYTHLVPILIEAIKDLSTELNQQKTAYGILEARLDKMDGMLLKTADTAHQE